MGDTGFEPDRIRSEKPTDSPKGNAVCDALSGDSNCKHAGGSLGEPLAPQRAEPVVRPELIAVVKTLLELDANALRALWAVISVLRTASANNP
jgi:hypothetical protein